MTDFGREEREGVECCGMLGLTVKGLVLSFLF